MAQQVEHVLGKDEVTGSSPVSSSIKTPNVRGFFFYKLLTIMRLYKKTGRKCSVFKY